VNVQIPIRLAAIAPVALAGILLTGCGATSAGTPETSAGNAGPGGANATATTGPTANATQPASGSGTDTPTASPTQPASGSSTASDAKCTDLTAAAASAALGKSVTVKLDTGGTQLAGLTVCDVVDADDVYPVQFSVNTMGSQALYASDEQSFGGVDLSGVGDEAFTSAVGVETLSGGVDIQVIGPAGPVLSKDYTIPTAIAKAMVAALN
jgi:hypothetical protein